VYALKKFGFSELPSIRAICNLVLVICQVRSLSPRVFVTGVAGFIGGHLADKLLDLGHEVVGFDNLSTGEMTNIAHATRDRRFRFVKGDLLDHHATMNALNNCNLVFHLAADPEVRAGAEKPDSQFRQNLLTTLNLLETARKRNTPTKLVFASTSTVYGEASVIPTPEEYGPMLPISTYGATKLGCEALRASYTQLLPLKVLIFRFANIVGSRAGHGVLHDFIMKLRRDPRQLEVLGDGTQTKSYLHVEDCVEAFVMALNEAFWTSAVQVYNIGTEDQTNVLRIAKIVSDAMHLTNVNIRTSGKLGESAWPGDVKTMRLDISKIRERGWAPKRSSDDAVRLAAKEMIRDLGIE
jgi:UDP-glucose 4-epimerase